MTRAERIAVYRVAGELACRNMCKEVGFGSENRFSRAVSDALTLWSVVTTTVEHVNEDQR